MTYSPQDIDTALKAIFEFTDDLYEVVVMGPSGWGRAQAIDLAAAKSWIIMRPEDEHSAVIRAAYEDLKKHGKFKFKDQSNEG